MIFKFSLWYNSAESQWILQWVFLSALHNHNDTIYWHLPSLLRLMLHTSLRIEICLYYILFRHISSMQCLNKGYFYAVPPSYLPNFRKGYKFFKSWGLTHRLFNWKQFYLFTFCINLHIFKNMVSSNNFWWFIN